MPSFRSRIAEIMTESNWDGGWVLQLALDFVGETDPEGFLEYLRLRAEEDRQGS